MSRKGGKSLVPEHLQKQARKAVEKTRKARKTHVDAAAATSSAVDDDDEIVREDISQEDLLQTKPGGETEQIQIDFTFCDSQGEDDELAVRSIMQKGWNGKLLSFNDTLLRKLAVDCTEQVEIGTFVKTEDDNENVLAFATVLDISKVELPVELKRKVSDILPSGKRVGWIIREALVNVPPQVTFQLLTCLKDDLEWAKEQKYASFDYLIHFAPCFADQGGAVDASGEPKSGKKKKQKLSRRTDVEYALSEDYVLANLADNSVYFGLSRPPPREGVDEPESLEHAPWACNALLLSTKSFYSAVNSLSVEQ